MQMMSNHGDKLSKSRYIIEKEINFKMGIW